MTTTRKYLLVISEKGGRHLLTIDEDGTIIHKGKTVEGPSEETAAATREALATFSKPTLNEMVNPPVAEVAPVTPEPPPPVVPPAVLTKPSEPSKKKKLFGMR